MGYENNLFLILVQKVSFFVSSGTFIVLSSSSKRFSIDELAATSPDSMNCSVWSKADKWRLSCLGLITKFALLNKNEFRCDTDTSRDLVEISTMFDGSGWLSTPLVIFTAMIKSQLSISGVTGVGKATPPSTRIRSTLKVCSKKPGIDELWSTASIKFPDLYMI